MAGKAAAMFGGLVGPVRGLALGTAAWLGATASAGDAGPSKDAEAAGAEPDVPTVEEVLAAPLADRDYSQSRRCLATNRYRRIDIVTDQALVFVGRGDTVWLNMLPYRCHGLRRDMVLVLEQSSMRVCARDRLRGLARSSAEPATAACALGQFQPLARENLAAMRDALVAARRNRTVARTTGAGRED